MKVFITIIASLFLISLLYSQIRKRIRILPKDLKSIDRNQYRLLLGRNATEVFKYYNVKEMHGLSLKGATKRIAENGSYIDGLANYHPLDTHLDMNLKPFLFLNLGSIQKNYTDDETTACVMHECMHMAGILFKGKWDSHEEEMITWAEKETNILVKLLKEKHFI